jgi:flavin reductase (DIM6/NTAB) family NADH-FMN oxidoreductase RutF
MVKPPRVAASPASMECRLLRIVDIEPTGPGETASNVVFGRVVGVHLDDRFIDADGRFDTARTEPLTRLDGNRYATVGRMDVLGRPSPRRD